MLWSERIVCIIIHKHILSYIANVYVPFIEMFQFENLPPWTQSNSIFMRTCVDDNVCNQAYRKNCFNGESAHRDI